MTSPTRSRGSLLLRLGSHRVSGFAIRGLGIIRAIPISRDRRKKPIEMHWHSLGTWLTSCLWVRALIRTIRYERKPKANKITALDAAMTLLFHILAHWRGASEFERWASDKC